MRSEQQHIVVALNEAIPLMRAAYSLPPISGKELDAAKLAWSAVLLDRVPACRVVELVKLAMHSSSETKRALSASDVLNLWRKVQAEEQDRKRVLRTKVCTACNNTGHIDIWSPETQQTMNIECPFHVKEKI